MPFASHAGKSVSKLTASCPPKIRALPPQRLHRGNPVFQSLVHYIPIHIGEEGVDVARRCGSEIHLVCMLIHVEDQERHCCCKCLGVVAGPSGSELPVKSSRPKIAQPLPPPRLLPVARKCSSQGAEVPQASLSAFSIGPPRLPLRLGCRNRLCGAFSSC